MCKLVLCVSAVLVASASYAALPPQYSECQRTDASTSLSAADMKAISKVSRVTYCQTQVGLINKTDTLELLKGKVDLAISLAKTNYSREDLLDLARSGGTYLLYVDSSKLSRPDLIELANAGVQLAIMMGNANLSREDLLLIAAAKPYILSVNSAALRDDLIALAKANVQLVIRTSNANLSGDDLVAIAKANAGNVTIMP
ncbi:hypothetical protein D3C72_1625420 [compost metagenome]